MKNFKTILLGIFAVISSTEISYPALGTRQRDDYAYQAGFEDGQNQGYLDENVEIQAMYDEEMNNYYNDMAKDISFAQLYAENEDNYTNDENYDDTNYADDASVYEDNNYADDASVDIQMINSDQVDFKPENQLKQASASLPLVEEATVQLEEIKPVVANAHVDARSVQPIVENATLHVEEIKPVAIETSLQVSAIKPAVESIALIHSTSAPTSIASSNFVKAVETSSDFAKATDQVHPEGSSTSTDQVKIVKVYPVYEAAYSAIKNVKAAAEDMFNYLYSFISKK